MTAADGARTPLRANPHLRTRMGLRDVANKAPTTGKFGVALDVRYDLGLGDGAPRAAQLACMTDEELVKGVQAMGVLAQEYRSSRAMHLLQMMYPVHSDADVRLHGYARKDHRQAQAVVRALQAEAQRRMDAATARVKLLRKALR